MVFDPTQFSRVVRDNYLGMTQSETPRFYTSHFDDVGCCLRIDKNSEYKKGVHFVVELTHKIGISIPGNMEEAYAIYHDVKSCEVFLKSIIKKLELTEENMYARAVLAYAIGYEEKTLLRIQDRMEELKRARHGV